MVMAEMPPLSDPLPDVIQPYNPMGDVQPKKFYCQQWLPDPDVMFILVDHNSWYHTTFMMYQAAINRKSFWQIDHSSCVYKAGCATGYPDILTQSTQDG